MGVKWSIGGGGVWQTETQRAKPSAATSKGPSDPSRSLETATSSPFTLMSGAQGVEASSSGGFPLLLVLWPPFILHNRHQNLLPKTWVQSCHSPAPQPLAVTCSLGDSPPSLLSRPFPHPCPPPGSGPSPPVHEGWPGPPTTHTHCSCLSSQSRSHLSQTHSEQSLLWNLPKAQRTGATPPPHLYLCAILRTHRDSLPGCVTSLQASQLFHFASYFPPLVQCTHRHW